MLLLVDLFTDADETIAAKLFSVMDMFPDFCSIAGDGNCFYRRCASSCSRRPWPGIAFEFCAYNPDGVRHSCN